jgi:hypothetical protein
MKEFYDFAQKDFEMMLGYAQMRWLALLPALACKIIF